MKWFNILGDCVSRDIFEFCGGVEISQYHSFSSPLSLCSKRCEYLMSPKDLEGNISKNYSNFMKRCIVYDFNKSVLEYVFAKKSDYFVLDILDARHSLLIKGDHCITLTNKMQEIESDIQEHFDLSGYKEYSPFTDISIEQWRDCICKLANEIRRHYVVNQIILNVHYGVMQYINENEIKDFSVSVVNNVELNIPASMSLLSGDRKPQIRFYGNRHSGYGNH